MYISIFQPAEHLPGLRPNQQQLSLFTTSIFGNLSVHWKRVKDLSWWREKTKKSVGHLFLVPLLLLSDHPLHDVVRDWYKENEKPSCTFPRLHLAFVLSILYRTLEVT